jgi:hypothetical protein
MWRNFGRRKEPSLDATAGAASQLSSGGIGADACTLLRVSEVYIWVWCCWRADGVSNLKQPDERVATLDIWTLEPELCADAGY